jgi:hypothetical protein
MLKTIFKSSIYGATIYIYNFKLKTIVRWFLNCPIARGIYVADIGSFIDEPSPFGATTLSITPFSITTLSIKGLHATLSISNIQHK